MVGVGVTFRMRGDINTPLIAVYVRNKDESELSKEALDELKNEQYEVTYNADMRLNVINSTDASVEGGAKIKIEKKGREAGQKETNDKWNQSEEGPSTATLGCLVSDDHGNHYGLTCWHAIDLKVHKQRNPNMDARFEGYKLNSDNIERVQKYRSKLIVRQNNQHIADFHCGQFCSTADVAALKINRGVTVKCNPHVHAITEDDVEMIEREADKEESEAEMEESEVGAQADERSSTPEWLFWAMMLRHLEVYMMGGKSESTSGRLITLDLELRSLRADEPPFQRVVVVDNEQMKAQPGDSGALWVVKWEGAIVPIALLAYSTKCEDYDYVVGHNIDDVLKALRKAKPPLRVNFCKNDAPCCSL